MPFTYTSPPAQTLVAFMISVVAGARRLAHFMRFRQGHIEEFWRPLWKWLLALSWPVPPEGFRVSALLAQVHISGLLQAHQGFSEGFAGLSKELGGTVVMEPLIRAAVLEKKLFVCSESLFNDCYFLGG